MVDGICFISIFEVSSSRCFILRRTHCKRTSMMDFTVKKFKNVIAQSAILLFTDLTTDRFWSRFQKLAVLKSIS